MNPMSSILSFAIALVVAGACAAENQATNLDNTILSLVLTESYPGGGYAVVFPKADLEMLSPGDAEYIKNYFLKFPQRLATNDPVVVLVDHLFERNKWSGTRKAEKLSLSSSPTNGYVVDHDGKYMKYFQTDGGDWPQFYKENPKARCTISISLPVYDKKTGLVLVYRGTHRHGLEGWGEVILYKYEKGKLTKLDTVCLWRA